MNSSKQHIITQDETIKATLIKAKELISEPVHWTKNALARTVYGEKIDYKHKNATCFCSIGAIKKVAKNDAVVHKCIELLASAIKKEVINALWLENRTVHENLIASYNDSPVTCHTEIINMFTKVIDSLPSSLPSVQSTSKLGN